MKYFISDRIKSLNNRLQTVDYYNPLPWLFDDINILDIPEYEWLKEESIVLRKAYATKYVAENLPIKIYENELIVGVPNQSSVEFGVTFPMYLTEEERQEYEVFGLNEYGLYGHHAPDWRMIIQKGTIGLRKDIEDAKAAAEIHSKTQIEEWEAMEVALTALEILANRYRNRCYELAMECGKEKRKEELLQISCILGMVPKYPANNLWEAFQSFWITYVLLSSNGEFLPLGRLDQHFSEYVKKIEIDEHLCDLIGCFLIKCNERNVVDANLLSTKEYKSERIGCYRRNNHYYHEEWEEDVEENKFFGQEANNRMMTAVLGGRLSNGKDNTNVLSFLFLILQDKLHLLFPTFGVRVHKDMDKDFFCLVTDILLHGQGEPVIYNEDEIIRNNSRLKVEQSDVYDFSSDGCWEVIFPGKSNFSYSVVYALQCLEWTMNSGKTLKTGKNEGLKTKKINTIDSYEDFYQVFLKQIEHQITLCADDIVENIGISGIVSPDPLLSVLCDGCIDKGEDFMRDGAKYQHRMLLLTGFADTVDSLFTIKELIFERKEMTLIELNKALECNWIGYDNLRDRILYSLPKYGNNETYVDEVAIRFMKDYSAMLTNIQRKYSHVIFTGGIGTFHVYALWGNGTSATANGRKAYEPLAPNYSPVPGTNICGPLAAIISSTKGDLSNFMTGTPLDIEINPNDFCDDDGRLRLQDIIKGFCELKGQIMTISSYTVEQLLEAKKNPEKYADLKVRMGGLSAYFVQLSSVAQDKILERFII